MRSHLCFVFLLFCNCHGLAQSKTKESMEIGRLYECTVGKTTFEEKLQYNKEHTWQEKNYGQITYSKWESVKQMGLLFYYAEVIPDAKCTALTDRELYTKAKFVSGYKMLVEATKGNEFYFKNVELGFYNDTLVNITSNVDTSFYNTVSHFCSPPSSYIVNYDTFFLPGDLQHKVVLVTRTYSWIKDGEKAEVIIKDQLSKEGMKRKITTYQITDIGKYALYEQKVAAEKARLDKEYAKGKQMMEK